MWGHYSEIVFKIKKKIDKEITSKIESIINLLLDINIVSKYLGTKINKVLN